MKQTIAIIGHGYVGQAIEAYFQEKFDIVLYDPLKGHDDKDAVNKADLAVVCVPTNMLPDGSVDLSIVREIFSWLKTPHIVLKSTVPPGTTQTLIVEYKLEQRMVFSPEFIGEGGYPIPHWEGKPHPTDMKLHHHLIFGGSDTARKTIIPFFERVSGPFAHYHQTDATTAELMKYMCNTWIATKVTFCNEFYDIADTLGVNWQELRELWLTDKRVEPSHTLVYKENRGFGGKCIPKDTNGLVELLRSKSYEPELLSSVLKVNKRLRVE